MTEEKKPQLAIIKEFHGSWKNVLYLLLIILIGVPILTVLIGIFIK